MKTIMLCLLLELVLSGHAVASDPATDEETPQAPLTKSCKELPKPKDLKAPSLKRADDKQELKTPPPPAKKPKNLLMEAMLKAGDKGTLRATPKKRYPARHKLKLGRKKANTIELEVILN